MSAKTVAPVVVYPGQWWVNSSRRLRVMDPFTERNGEVYRLLRNDQTGRCHVITERTLSRSYRLI